MKDLTKGKEAKQILYFALPMLLGNLFQQLYNIVDSIIAHGSKIEKNNTSKHCFLLGERSEISY